MTTFENYEELFQIPSIDGRAVAIGRPIGEGPMADEELSGASAVWPIYFNDRLAAYVIEGRDSGGKTFRLKTADQSMAVADSQRSSALAADGGCERLSLDAEIEYLSENAQESSDRGEEGLRAAPAARAGTSVRLNVQTGKQSNMDLWWASGVACVGKYLANSPLNDYALSNGLFGGVSSGSISDSVRAFSLIKYPSSSTAMQAKYFNRTISNAEIKNWIQNGIPFCVCGNSVAPYTATACGWSYDASGRQVLTIMNPRTGHYEATTINSNGTQTSSGFAWTHGAIVPVGWQKPFGGSKWSYMNQGGTRSYGWLKVGNYWYWFDSSGYMTTGWQKVSGKWYWMDSGGAAVTGWKKIGGYWYAFDSSCAMRTGWFKDGSTWYYLRTAANTPASGPEGAMLAGGTWTIGGKAYRFDSSGACLNP